MKKLFKDFYLKYKNLDNFLKFQTIDGFISNISWCLIIPLIHKLQGLYWTTTYISLYLILMRFSGLIIPFFEYLKYKDTFIYLFISTIIYSVSLLLYFIDINLFLIVEVFISILFAIIVPIHIINFELLIVEKYNTDLFKDYKYIQSFRDSLSGILGYLFTIVFSLFLYKESYIIICFFIFILFAISVKLYNYNSYIKRLTN